MYLIDDPAGFKQRWARLDPPFHRELLRVYLGLMVSPSSDNEWCRVAASKADADRLIARLLRFTAFVEFEILPAAEQIAHADGVILVTFVHYVPDSRRLSIIQ